VRAYAARDLFAADITVQIKEHPDAVASIVAIGVGRAAIVRRR
jgi:hypothetical protein